MKWYSCLNEDGLEKYRDHLAIAIASCRANTDMEPHVIFDGDPEVLRQAVGTDDVVVHRRRTGLMQDILNIDEKPGFKHRIAAGAFLRLEIAHVEREDEFVLYTDCDVIFRSRIDLSSIRPVTTAAAPDADPNDWSTFNSGVMVFNVPAMRSDYAALLDCARPTLGTPHFYDQGVYNIFYGQKWTRLPLVLHWKPYWGYNRDAAILHFHGPKLEAVRRLLSDADAATHELWRETFNLNKDAYARYLEEAERYLR